MPVVVHGSPVLGDVSGGGLSDRLVVEHLELARKLAYRYAGRGEPVDELVQVAMVGLVQAAKRYDPQRGNGFVPYAVPTILGEIRRYFRDQCWAVRVPRPLHDLYRDILTVRDRLSAVLGRSPTPAELAAELEVGQDQVLRALECATAYGAVSLDAPDTNTPGATGGAATGEGRTLGETLGAHDQDLDVVEQREAVRGILNQLPERERRILVLRYFGDRTQAQIANELGISQMHVSRLLASTINRIRTALTNDTPPPLHWPTPRNHAA